MQSYRDKLIEWNSTDKYKKELMMLSGLLRGWEMKHCNVLDIGCGIGTAMDWFNADGFDVNEYYYGSGSYYLNYLPNKKYDYIYLMHSLSHIHNPLEVLKDLKQRYNNAVITVITPNSYWLMLQKNPNYKPDPTVVKHYTQTQLKELFEQAGYEIGLIGQFGEETNGVNERIFLQTK